MKTVMARLRQLAFPRALRIDEPTALAPGPALDALRAWLVVPAPDPPPPGPIASAPPPSPIDAAFVVKLANITWRLAAQARKLGPGGQGRNVQNRVDSLTGLLQSQQVEIVDYSGQDFDAGEIWDEVIFDPRDKTQPFISEMQLPRVRWRGEVVQRGKPIVEDRNNEQGENE